MVLAFLRQSLWASSTTAAPAGRAHSGLDIAGKTGTAQTVAKLQVGEGQDHAWFAAFARSKDPEVLWWSCSSSAAATAARPRRPSPSRSSARSSSRKRFAAFGGGLI